MRASYRDASKEMQGIETALQQDEASLKKLRDMLLQLPRADEANKVGEEAERVQQQLNEASRQVAALADAAQQVEATSKALSALGDPRLQYKVASEKANRRKGLEAQLAQTEQEMAAAQTELDKLQKEIAAFGDLDAQLDAVAATQELHHDAYHIVLRNRDQAERLPVRVQEAAALARELAIAKESATVLEREYQAAAANFDQKAYDEALDRQQTLEREAGELRGQLTTQEKTQQSAEQELGELRALTAQVAAGEAKIARLKDEEEVLENIRTKLRHAGPYISEALNRQISDGARQIFSDIMQDYSRHLTWQKDYSITLEVDGRERSFSQLSGGEQMSAALAVRLALLREMSSIDIAFFDEPTANLDEVRREALARQILNVRGFKQLFVISHDDTFEQATQNLVRVERVGGVSRVTSE
jgi:exonuclease SbcC